MNDFIFDFDDSIPEFDIVVQHVTTEGGGGGQTIEIDSELSTTSNNPVKNKVITVELNKKINASSLATVATSGSYNDLTNKPTIPSSFPVDVELSETSTNPVQNAVITNALGDKMDYPRGGISGQVLQKTAEGAQWASIGTPSQEQIDEAVTEYINDHPEVISGLSEAAKVALLQIAQKVAYVDTHGQDYYDALYDAFYPPAELVGITAVYTQSGTVYDTDSLDDLKPDLVVTALYSDSTSEVITSGYMLSGTLTAGTSTITVSYGGQTATFTVNVTHVTVETLWISGYADSNATQAKGQYSPFYYAQEYYTYTYPVKVLALELKILTAGTLTIGHQSNATLTVGTSQSTIRAGFVADEVITFSATGKQKVYLQNPITLTSDNVLAIGTTTDTAVFAYGYGGTDKHFYYCNSTLKREANQSLGVNVYIEGA